MVPRRRLELPRPIYWALAPQASVSTNSTTTARLIKIFQHPNLVEVLVLAQYLCSLPLDSYREYQFHHHGKLYFQPEYYI